MKILVVPDLHGKEIWWEAVKYDEWDHIVFLGDYVDAFDIHDYDITNNLHNIIQYKKNHYNKVTLLWGNHDLQYLYVDDSRYRCSGFRNSYCNQLHNLFHDNKKMFRYAKQIDKYLFTHAGVQKHWWDKTLIMRETLKISELPIAEQIHMIASTHFEFVLADVGYKRGGHLPHGGIVWADLEEFHSKHHVFDDIIQIAGHNRQIKKVFHAYDWETSEPINIWHTDCLDTVNEFLYIEDGEIKTFTLETV